MSLNPYQGTTAGGTQVKITGGPWDEETVMAIVVMFGDVAAQAVNGNDNDKGANRLQQHFCNIAAPRGRRRNHIPHRARKRGNGRRNFQLLFLRSLGCTSSPPRSEMRITGT